MRKVFLVSLLIGLLACALAVSVGATGFDYSEKAILADGTVLPIYDEEQNPLIWYVSGTDNEGNNTYASVPNNRNSATSNNDTYVTYTINTGYKTQLQDINYHIWNPSTGAYDVFTEKSLETVVVNLRGVTDFIYVHKSLKVSDIQYIYFNETLYDFCEYFKGSTSIRLIDLTACTNLEGGLGGTRNFNSCSNLHTIRLAPGVAYSLKCKNNSNWRFSGTAIKELVVPANVTDLGVDNFKNLTSIERIYIMGNTTSLGQRNFYGCTNLTSIYILGDNPEIDVNTFRENFYQCIDGNTTYDFTEVGKYFYFVTTDTEYLTSVATAIDAVVITYGEYKANPSAYADGRYVISGTNICDVYYGQHNVDEESAGPCFGVCDVCGENIEVENPQHALTTEILYVSYDEKGTKRVSCENEGCSYCVSTEAPALFECWGYSVPENGVDGISLTFRVNNSAISEYENVMSVALKYGVFAVAKDKIGSNDIFNGEDIVDGVITAEMSLHKNDIFEIKLVGFTTAEQKNALIVMGAYVNVGDGISYLQASKADDGEKYHSTYLNAFVKE